MSAMGSADASEATVVSIGAGSCHSLAIVRLAGMPRLLKMCMKGAMQFERRPGAAFARVPFTTANPHQFISSCPVQHMPSAGLSGTCFQQQR
jgi:hypothetical protein